jgi:TRAP-type C4-dicarboxylate transport system substrate-binding protein
MNRSFRILTILSILLWSSISTAQTLKIATIAPEGSFWMVEMRAAAKQIDADTEGRVKFRFYGGGVQGNDNQVRRKMRIGQLHGATFTSGALGEFAPDTELYSLALLFRNMEEVAYVREHMDKALTELLENAGMVNFGFTGAGFGYLMSNQPVTTLSDLSGQKTWMQEGDDISYAAFKALGISPVVMPLTDVLTGLQTELLDSAAVSPVGAVVLQLHTKLSYVTDLPLAYVYGALVIDAKAFSRLSEPDGQLVRSSLEGLYKKFDEASISDNDNALSALVERGLILVEPDTSQLTQWQKLVDVANSELAQSGEVSQALYQQLLSILEEYRATTGQ